jgi:class 3 adenylate cyclase
MGGREVGEVQYAKQGDVYLAYRVLGEGPRDLLLMSTWFVPIDAMIDGPMMSRALDRLSSMGRLILFDRRGIGLSDPISPQSPPTLEQWMGDAVAVLNEVGSETATVLGLDPSGAQVAIYLAAAKPERVHDLVLFNAHARLLAGPDYPIGTPRSEMLERIERIVQTFVSGDAGFDMVAPSAHAMADARSWWTMSRRRGASPATIRALLLMAMTADVSAVLGAIQAPTLVMHRSGSRTVAVEHGRYLAEHISHAKYVELPGEDSLFYVGDTGRLFGELEEFITGNRVGHTNQRTLATVLFTDIANSTLQLVEVGDERWHDLLEGHHAVVRRQLERFSGREVKTTGDGFLATFDGPAGAIECACAIRDALRQLGLEVRSGIHTGEVEIMDGDVAGIAVHIGQRVSGFAQPGEVLVSRTVVDLVSGSGIGFADRGERHLKGVPGTWRLFAVEQ